MNRRFAALGLLLALSGSGCARPDWIESTLATAEIGGHWSGYASQRFSITLQLAQSGAKVTGGFAMTGAGVVTGGMTTAGEIEGSLNGDVFRFRQVGGDLVGELTVGIDEMTGWMAGLGTRFGGPGRFTVILTRP